MSGPHADPVGITRRSLLRALGAGAGLATVAGIAGCAPSVQPHDVNAGGGLTDDDGVETFAFTTWMMGETASRPLVQPSLDAYQASTGVTIETPSLPYADFLRQLVLQVQGGQTAGPVQLDITWLSVLGTMGAALDLAPLAEGTDYTDQALALGRYKGRQIGLPWTSGAIGLLGNSDLLDKAGIREQPETIDDFEAALVELKGAGQGVVPYAAMTKVAQLKDVVVWMWTFGSPVVENGRITVGDDASVEALTWYKKLYDTGLIGKDIDRADARALFGQEMVALYDDVVSARTLVAPNAKDPKIGDKLVAWKRPVRDAGDTPQSMAWGHAIAIIGGGPGEYAAGRFVKHVTSDPDNALDYFERAGYPPVTETALTDKRFTKDRFASEFATRITETAQADPLWQFPKSAQIYETLAQQVQAILIGDTTPKEGLATARERMQKLVT
ncbi:MAG: extracellular solute-binding protein [Streptosporangiales bacterium]|nr:extracellular solute-binding protein [Streptosporangiales bacterium]